MVDHDSLPEELERSSPELPQLVTDPEFRALGPPFRPEGRNQVATIIRDYPPSAIALAAPPMSEAEYQELKDNIAAHGLRNPIVLIGNRILDGLPRLTDFVARNLVPLETAERFVRLEQKFAKIDECGFWFYGGTFHERIDEATFSRRNRAAPRNARQAAATGNSRNED